MTFHPKMPYETGLHRSARQLPDPGEPFAFTPERRARLEEIAARYPPERRRSALLPALHLVQHQQGHVSARAMEHVAEVIGVTPAEVEDVVSDGGNRPVRVKMRSPSLMACQALEKMARGGLLADVVAVIGSSDVIMGDVDR